MTQLHRDELAHEFCTDKTDEIWLPLDEVKELPGKWVTLKDHILYLPNEQVPDTLCKDDPVLEHNGHLYVYGYSTVTQFAIKYGELRSGMPDAEVLLKEYTEDDVFNVESVASCVSTYCEMSFGFSTTHRDYTGTEPDILLEKFKQVHGPQAAGTINTIADAIGYSTFPGLEEFCSGELARLLLQLAQVQSDWHRGYRTNGAMT